jgi:hypothetical protein
MSTSEQGTFTSDELRLVRHNPWMLALAASPALLSVAAFVAGLVFSPPFFAVVLHPLIIALVALVYVVKRRPRAIVEPIHVRADRHALTLGAETLPRATLREGLIVPAQRDRGPQVELRRKGSSAAPIRLAIQDREQGRRLLHALGFDASQTTASFRALSMVLSRPRYTFLAIALFMVCLGLFAGTVAASVAANLPALIALGAVPFVLGYAGLLGAFLTPSALSTGTDGLMVKWLWWKRFVPYRDILSVARFETGWGSSNRKGLTLLLHSGEQVRVPVSQDDEAVAIVDERIQEAMESYRRHDTEGDATMLRRNGREIAAWITTLRSLGAGSNADLRTAPLPRERLFRIVESPTAEAGDRAAAAVALGTDLDQEGRARLASAAAATAAPRLRIAIEKAAESADEEALREALSALVDEQGEGEDERARRA